MLILSDVALSIVSFHTPVQKWNSHLRSIHTMRFSFCISLYNLRQAQKNGFYTHSLRLTQHPIDAMLQFDANANTHANVDASVNGPLGHTMLRHQ